MAGRESSTLQLPGTVFYSKQEAIVHETAPFCNDISTVGALYSPCFGLTGDGLRIWIGPDPSVLVGSGPDFYGGIAVSIDQSYNTILINRLYCVLRSKKKRKSDFSLYRGIRN